MGLYIDKKVTCSICHYLFVKMGYKTHMLLNSKALLEEDGSIDHHIDIVLRLGQRVVVVIHIQLHRLAQSLEDDNFSLRKSVQKKLVNATLRAW